MIDKEKLLAIARDIRDDILIDVKHCELSYVPSEGQMGAANGALNKATGSTENRRLVIEWLFHDFLEIPFTGKGITTKGFSSDMWFGIIRWVGMYKDDSDGWGVSHIFPPQAQIVLVAALFEAGKADPLPVVMESKTNEALSIIDKKIGRAHV